MATSLEWAKFGINSIPKIIAAWVSIAAILAGLGVSGYSYLQYEPEIPVEAKQEAVQQQIEIIEAITAPPKIMTKTITLPVCDCKPLEDRVKVLEEYHP